MSANRQDITLLLRRMNEGEPGALDQLMGLVHGDLNRMAASHLRRQFGDQVDQVTLEPAALVNESFLLLIKQRKGFDSRGQFFAIATRLMLRVLAEYRRDRGKRVRRAGGTARMTLAFDQQQRGEPEPQHLVEVEELISVLERLEKLDPRRAEVVKMRVVWGMTIPEMADALDVSESSISRDWTWARAWLADELGLLGE